MIMSVIRLAIGVVPVTMLAIAFSDFNLSGWFRACRLVNQSVRTSWAVGSDVSAGDAATGSAPRTSPDNMFIFLPLTGLLTGGGVAGGCRTCLAAAATYVSREWGPHDRPRVPPRPDASIPGPTHAVLYSPPARRPLALLKKRPPERFPDAERGMTVVFIWLI